MGEIETTLKFQSLKYQCGRQMWCKGCETCLDVNDAVSIDAIGVVSGKLHSTFALCGKCADKAIPSMNLELAAQRAGEPVKVETFDGRLYDVDGFPLPGVEITVELSEFKTRRNVAPKEAKRRKYEFVPVSGYNVALEGFEEFGFAAYESPDNKGQWFLIELSTGASLASGDSPKTAATKAMASLAKHGKSKFAALVAKSAV